MKRIFSAGAVLAAALLAGCSQSGDNRQIVFVKGDLSTLSCEELSENIFMQYLIIWKDEDDLKKGLHASKGSDEYKAALKKSKDPSYKDTVDSVVKNYKNVEKAYAAKCPMPPKDLPFLRQKHPTARI